MDGLLNVIWLEFALALCSLAVLIIISVNVRSINRHLERIELSLERQSVIQEAVRASKTP